MINDFYNLSDRRIYAVAWFFGKRVREMHVHNVGAVTAHFEDGTKNDLTGNEYNEALTKYYEHVITRYNREETNHEWRNNKATA